MAMTLGGGGSEPEVMVDINTTPLIDVLLVLLIMLIITIPVQMHAVKLDMPVNTPADPTAVVLKPIDLFIDFDGTVYWDGGKIDSRDQLEQLLQVEGGKSLEDQREFHIRPDKLTDYKYVAAVLASAQRFNVTKIGLVNIETASQ